ncbi:hypothetical protein D0862_08015 [Hortaea werneckii]|uniref:Peroxin 11C n=1 Tax=Hortaea werneckii TaxID=91943 RepID=A0A3M7GA43_HORWE|nr:hypothetical protein D0862_08015 [Hortaea werneckii]
MSGRMANSVRSLLTILRPVGNRTDAFLAHLHRTLSTSAGVESLITTVCFTAIFVHARLRHLLERQYERLAVAMATNASKSMLPGEILMAEIEPPQTRLAELCASVKTVADVMQDYWIFFRLWGLVGIYNSARENYLKPPGDAPLKLLTWLHVATGATFQLLENGAYLASKGVLRGEKWTRRESRWAVWSNRFWLAQVLVDGLRLLRVRQLRYREEFGAKEAEEVDGKEFKIQSEALRRKWQRDAYADAGWLPVTLHWSFEDENNSPVSDTWLGLGGMIPGVIGFWNAWEETSDSRTSV